MFAKLVSAKGDGVMAATELPDMVVQRDFHALCISPWYFRWNSKLKLPADKQLDFQLVVTRMFVVLHSQFLGHVAVS